MFLKLKCTNNKLSLHMIQTVQLFVDQVQYVTVAQSHDCCLHSMKCSLGVFLDGIHTCMYMIVQCVPQQQLLHIHLLELAFIHLTQLFES